MDEESGINTHTSISDEFSREKGGNLYEIQVVNIQEIEEEEGQGEGEVEEGEGEGEGENTTDQEDEVDWEDMRGSLFGMKKDTADEMYELYRKHARSLGFSVRKSTNRFSTCGNHILLGKLYVCSCSGLRRNDNNSLSIVKSGKRKTTAITRTGCTASMLIKRNEDGRYEVTKHNQRHNHELTRPEWSHLHRSERQITEEKGKAIKGMLSLGMRVVDIYRYMANEVGGEERLGHTMKDHYNFVHQMKLEAMKGGDVNNLLVMMEEQESKEDDFFFKVKLNEEWRLTSLFWRDSLMKEDYEIYGDVVVFDTTYRTNKYDMICAPFVGVNNHWRNVMFGCAFLSNEKRDTFEWLFQTFKKSMQGKCPITLFTDQDLAIANAIEKVFPETRHRLCLWHIQQNAISRFGELKGNGPFKDAFSKCLMGCVDKNDFENNWKNMISTYGLEGNDWFSRLYGLKEKWCTTLSKSIFSAGIRSSQRSESTNHAIGFRANKKTSLTEFYGILKNTVNLWRSKETSDEFYCGRTLPEKYWKMRGILKHAANMYTSTMFKRFEEEFFKAISLKTSFIEERDSIVAFDVFYEGVEQNKRVEYDRATQLITCECKKFGEFGMLCCHSLRIFLVYSLEKIPDQYILKRWCKNAKLHVWDDTQKERNDKNSNSEKYINCTTWRNRMMRTYYNIVLMSQGNETTRKIAEEGSERDIMAITTANAVEQEDDNDVQSESSRMVLDPELSITKGRSKRIKSGIQKSKKKKTTTSQSSQGKEFGSKTPNPHLI